MWPHWNGATAMIVGRGASAAAESLEPARGLARVIAIKSSWKLVPWSDVLYGADGGWWTANNGVPDFPGMKVSPSPAASQTYRDVRLVSLVKGARILTDQVGRLCCGSRLGGGHSGFQAVNLAVQFGATRILLVGFDMDRPHDKDYREEMDAAAPQFAPLGVEVINCSPVSMLTAFPKMSLCEVLRDPQDPRRADRPRHRIDAGRRTLVGGAVEAIRDDRP